VITAETCAYARFFCRKQGTAREGSSLSVCLKGVGFWMTDTILSGIAGKTCDSMGFVYKLIQGWYFMVSIGVFGKEELHDRGNKTQ
jgi:hypothetical protein